MEEVAPVDDPYKILAARLVFTSSNIALGRILTDTKYIRKRIAQEAREQWVYLDGPFLDCIATELYAHGKRRELKSTLARMGYDMARYLDVQRLRAEITKCCEDFGIEPFFPIQKTTPE